VLEVVSLEAFLHVIKSVVLITTFFEGVCLSYALTSRKRDRRPEAVNVEKFWHDLCGGVKV
jgi:hypothetical protein